MSIIRQSTQVVVRIGPAIAVGDGFTPVVTLALGTADEAELLKAAGVATVDISAATFAAVTGADGWYDLTLTTSHTDTVGDLTVIIQDDSLILPIFARFQVVEEAVYDAMFASGAVGPLPANSDGTVLTEAGGTGDHLTALATAAALTAAAAEVTAIKAKTDSLTFTVGGQVDANIQSINDVTIVGDGSATPFNV